MGRNSCKRVLSLAGVLLALAGCSAQGAPSLILFGAYFPGWMLCGLLGIIGAIAARVIIVALGLATTVPFPLFVSASAGLIVATALWLSWFGR